MGNLLPLVPLVERAQSRRMLIVVGTSSIAGDVESHAFLFEAGVMKDLGTLGGAQSSAIRINSSGLVAGNSLIEGDEFNHAFVYKDRAITDLGTLGGKSSCASDMNEQGWIIGQSQTKDGNYHAFQWSNGSMADIGVLNDSYISSDAIDINSNGQVVGTCTRIPEYSELLFPTPDWIYNRPFLYSDGLMTDINDLVDGPHGTFFGVQSIDDSGQITVTGAQMIDWGLYRQYTCVLTPVPEPSSAILLLFGLFVIAVRARRKRQERNPSLF
jgi:probable HAF family extracellular repeat protein